MSFILDALKKSESDRQRQNGPALFEVKVASPRTRLPLWAIAIAALLVVNLGIAMWMLLRHPARAAADAAPPAASAALSTPPPAVPQAAPPATASAPPPATSAPATAAAPAASPAPPAAATQVAAVPAGAVAGTAAGTPGSAAPESNPEDYTPAEEPAATGLGNRVRRSTASGVPLYQDAAATPGTQIPQLRLDLHVFAARPQDRFVMINMRKLREGDSLPQGVHVESITPDGAVLSYNGSRFLLPRE